MISLKLSAAVVFSAFEGLKGKIESETEIILRDTQETLDNLNDLKQKEQYQKEMERLHDIVESASAIVQKLLSGKTWLPVYGKLTVI